MVEEIKTGTVALVFTIRVPVKGKKRINAEGEERWDYKLLKSRIRLRHLTFTMDDVVRTFNTTQEVELEDTFDEDIKQ